MIGKLIIAAIVLDVLLILTGGISGARQAIAWLSIFVFFILAFTSIGAGSNFLGRIIYSSIISGIALGILVAPVSIFVRDAHLSPGGRSTECETGIGGQMICR